MRVTCRTLPLAAAIVAGLASAAPSTEPPLPEGAHPEWSASKAWQRKSARRGEICLNGLWRFRSEPRLKPLEVVETFFEDDVEESGLRDWAVGRIPGGTIRASADTSRKVRGDSSMKVELDIPKATNFYHLTRLVQGVPTGVKLVLRADMWVEMERGQVHVEVQDARYYTFYTARCGTFGSTGKWKTIECDLILPADTKTVKILILRNHGSPSGCKGTVWIDNVRIVRVERPAAPGIAPPTDDA